MSTDPKENLKDEIKKYYSPIFGNDVPDPIAYGEKNIYFIFIVFYHLFIMWIITEKLTKYKNELSNLKNY